MQDYMRALRQRFDTPLNCETLNRELEQVRGELHEALNNRERKFLLRLTDLENAIRDETSLHSFTAGYRLACGIHRELAQEPPYSFDQAEERCAETVYLKEHGVHEP